MYRREFLQLLSIGTVCLAGGPLLQGCSSQENCIRGGSPSTELSIDPEADDILYRASLAPSGHNAQPWQVLIRDKKNWLVGVDKTRLLSEVDPDGRETWISLGAFCENMSIAATRYGLDAEFSKSGNSLYPIAVTFHERRATVANYDAIISRRCTRRGLSNDELQAGDVDFLRKGMEDVFQFYPRGTEAWEEIKELTIEANREQSANDKKQTELAEWIRWSDSDIQRHRDGLTPDSMGITGIAKLYVKLFYDKGNVMSNSFREKSVDLAREQANAGGGWLVVKSDGKTEWDYLQAGRLFERMFLHLEERKIGLQPMNQAIEEPDARIALSTALPGGNDIIMICRLGYVESYGKIVSPRRPVAWFTKKGKDDEQG